MVLPREKIEESETKIPCTDYAVIKLLKRIQTRLGVDDTDLAFELNEYAKKKYLKWARWVTEKDIIRFKRGKPLPSDKDFQVINWVIRNMTKQDREVVFYGIGECDQARGASTIFGDQQGGSIPADSNKELPLRPTGIKTGLQRRGCAGLAQRA